NGCKPFKIVQSSGGGYLSPQRDVSGYVDRLDYPTYVRYVEDASLTDESKALRKRREEIGHPCLLRKRKLCIV
ncbi:hypothetical protein BSL78_28041, partial [Apostichopus japonicus]